MRGEYTKGGIFELAFGKRKNEAFPRAIGNIEEVATPEEFLKAVNFEELNAILHTLAKRSGIQHTRDITPSDVSFTESLQDYAHEGSGPGTHVGGAADPLHYKIKIDWNDLVAMKEKYAMTAPLGLLALESLLHEAVHLYSFHEMSRVVPEGADEDAPVSTVRRVFGYQEQDFTIEGTPGISTANVSFNEAVTEQLALQVFDEYLTRTGDRSLLKKYPEASKEISTATYANDRMLLNATIDALARRLEVDRDLIWKSFVQGYIFKEERPRKVLVRIASELIADSRIAAVNALELDSPTPIQGTPQEVTAGMTERDIEEALDRVIHGIRTEEIQDALGLR